jgi:hypothetical protein
MGRVAAVLAGSVALVGCAGGPIVQSELPIKRVVVYRNGVAYFERKGHVAKDEVRFQMRKTEVGDFLATLAVMEEGGSSVRSAAFPLKDAPAPKHHKHHEPGDDDEDDEEAAKRQEETRDMRTVVLALDGRAHDLQVGYIAAAPVWRPSYRLVVQPDGQADLQAWGIVQNLSGEDWTNVQISLVAGAPLAFEARLGTPIVPERPVVTDQGEIIAAMPRGETSVAQKDEDHDGVPDEEDKKKTQPPPPPPPAEAAAASAPAPSAAPRAWNGAPGDPMGGYTFDDDPKSASRPRGAPSAPRRLSSLAAIAIQGGSTRYDIPTVITVPDKSATMVMLLSRRVPGEGLYLYAPDDGVPDSTSHPFHVVRFQNGTPGMLERGPIAVFEQGSFLGQGLLEPLPKGGSATVPFALERGIGVTHAEKYDTQGTRLSKIEDGNLWLEHDSVRKTTYELENGQDKPAKLLVKHPRQNGMRLFEPPPGTEDNTGAGSALVPTTVPAHGKNKLVVDERDTASEYADWFTIAADNAVKAYLVDPRANREVVQGLSAAWPIRLEIVAKQDQQGKLQRELSELNREAQEKRADLKAIEKNKAAEALRKKLTERLAAISTRQDALTAQNVQLGNDLSELKIHWRDAIRTIKLAEPPPPKP